MTLQLFDTLVPALLHTLWIGLVSTAGLFLALQLLPANRARLRYALGIVALLSIFLGGLIAWELPNATAETTPVVSFQENQSDAPPAHPLRPSVSSHLPEPQASSLKPQASPHWHLWLGLVWMAGAGMSLLRLMRISFGIQQLVRRSRVVENPVAIRLVVELSRIAGTSRRVLLLTGEHIIQPAVSGILRPAIFLPLTVLTGLPEWQLRAILAHELAHIVRRDFLVNALQLLSETLLFFNPAVWWINRRIRDEREACCDALAARWIDSNHDLAETLIDQAAFRPTALPAFSDSNPSTLKSRILRLVNPAQQPRLKLPWKSLLLVLLFAVGGLAIAKKGTSEVVGYLKRVQTLEIAREEFASDYQKEQLMVSGGQRLKIVEMMIATDDGAPLEFPIFLKLYGDASYDAVALRKDTPFIEHLKQGVLRAEIPIRVNSILTRYEVSAPSRALARGQGVRTDSAGRAVVPTVTLIKGFDARVRCVDDEGKPVEGVKLWIKGKGASRLSNKNGVAIIPNVTGDKAEVMGFDSPDGYLFKDERDCVFESNKVVEARFKRALPFPGVVKNARGNPIAGARITPMRPGWDPWWVDSRRYAVISDDQGRFTIRRFAENQSFSFIVEAPGYMGKLVSSAQPATKETTITLAEARTIRLLVKDAVKREKFNLYVKVDSKRNRRRWVSVDRDHIRRVKIIGEDVLYELDLVDASYEISANWSAGSKRSGSFLVKFDGTTVANELTIGGDEKLGEYKAAVRCAVNLRFIPPEGERMPKGGVEIRPRGNAPIKTYVVLPANGIVKTEIKMSPSEELVVSTKNLNGYAFWSYIQPDGTNYVADCHLRPAGAIAIECVDEAGTPIERYAVYTGSRNAAGEEYWHEIIRPRKPTCLREPLALSVEEHLISVAAWQPRGQTNLVYRSEWITLNEDEPVKKLRCVLKPETR